MLPAFVIGTGTAPPVWPREQIPFALAVAAAMPRPAPPSPEVLAEVERCGGWQQYFEAQKIREAEAVAEQGRDRERGREALNNMAAAVSPEQARRHPGV